MGEDKKINCSADDVVCLLDRVGRGQRKFVRVRNGATHGGVVVRQGPNREVTRCRLLEAMSVIFLSSCGSYPTTYLLFS